MAGEGVRILKRENVERERCAKRMNVRAQRGREESENGGGEEGREERHIGLVFARSMKENT